MLSPNNQEEGWCEVDVYELLRGLSESEVELRWKPTRGGPVILAIFSEKGGVGKTGLTNGLAAVAAKHKLRVLVIDLDPRATATSELGVEKPEYSINDLLYIDASDPNPVDPRGLAGDAISPAGEGWPDNVHVLAAERALGNREFDNTSGMEQRLRLSLDGVAESYDLVLIDVPPRPGGKLMTAAALAATHALLPATLDEDGYIGVHDGLISLHRARVNHGLPPLIVVGVLRNIVDRRRSGLAEAFDEKLAQEYPPHSPDGLRLLDAAVPKYVIRQESRSARVPFTVAGTSEATLLERAYCRTLNCVAEVA